MGLKAFIINSQNSLIYFKDMSIPVLNAPERNSPAYFLVRGHMAEHAAAIIRHALNQVLAYAVRPGSPGQLPARSMTCD